jgi:hypothetical protein
MYCIAATPFMLLLATRAIFVNLQQFAANIAQQQSYVKPVTLGDTSHQQI